ncbi:helix-turn-helix domain-containing protein [Streptomyces albireticuli]|uniref:MerR family transcriptional regulator n=1 Tax=Streptomyces albireticuli TaxID=1940 RepID=A0A2A2CY03_9ACTN|nr:MerR family transcriptional regulator [Streptomyces albireticuli]MCD9141404.1 MerR family DNA-binding transcriptional regulator [Streptomyces albireticuli]MCD9160635.1 MerR family DNA-binding transcriptional regulator [Streptomyces albireticuli]MCD9195809.1 MerR family DNA-binding transcriptional regulator [Streptomyces albireticuli]PAU44135.1 MerR family transcriptional regulator [Streptomyces albireticuli]
MDVTLSIGELAARAGLSVKAIRYYTDIGLLPTAPRSEGGHRRYPPQALEQLRLVRQLRALDVPIAAITGVATGGQRLGDLVAEQLAGTRARLAELRWREAALQALEECSGPERLRRLRVLAQVRCRPQATTDLARAWERVLPPGLPARLADAITAQAVPEPPRDPTPDAVLAYAELHFLVAEPAFLDYWAASHVRDKASLYAALLDASDGAAPAVAAGRAPHGCEAMDALCRACARAHDTKDTSGFRAFMATDMQTTVPLFRRYWQRLDTLTSAPGPSLGRTHCWLVEGVIAEHGPASPGAVNGRPPAPGR